MDASDNHLYQQALDIVSGAFESGDSSSGSGATTILHRALTDLGNAERLIDRKGDDLRYIFPWKKWLVWDGTRWGQDDCGLVYAWTEEMVRAIGQSEAALATTPAEYAALTTWAEKSESRGRIESALALARSMVALRPDRLDQQPWLLNTTTGTVDLRTAELREHSRDDLLTKWTGVPYDPAAPCPRFETFVSEIMGGDEQLIAFLRRALGYAITGSVREHVLFFLWGDGSNGKSTLINAIRAALGDYAIQAVSDLLLAKRHESHPTERADLFGRRFVATIEVEDGRELAEALTKQLTGGDNIRARRMFEDFWEFPPTHKLFLVANHKPTIKGDDQGIWRRILLVPFTQEFVDPDDDGTIPKGKHAKDRTLDDALKAEAPGILRWLVEGALAWQESGLRPPPAVIAATEEYRKEMDSVRAYVNEVPIRNAAAKVPAGTLFSDYAAWCERNGLKAVTITKLGTWLKKAGYQQVHES
jgi:putative DNA primase/helicase